MDKTTVSTDLAVVEDPSGWAEGNAVAGLLAAYGGSTRVEVHDRGRGSLPAPKQPPPFDEGGRGLCLVQALANTWGWHQEDDTTGVWFEVLVET